MNLNKKINNVLNEVDIKITRPRQLILSNLLKSNKPKTVDNIFSELNQSEKTIDRATIYRNLSVFKQAGIVRSIDLDANDRFYQSDIDNDSHQHYLVCLKCRKVEDVPKCLLSNAQIEGVKESKGFAEIKNHSLEFFGTCKKCQI